MESRIVLSICPCCFVSRMISLLICSKYVLRNESCTRLLDAVIFVLYLVKWSPNNRKQHCIERRLYSLFSRLPCITKCCQSEKKTVTEQLERFHKKQTNKFALVNRKDVVLVHDNATPHVAKVTSIFCLGRCIIRDYTFEKDRSEPVDDVGTTLDGLFASRSKELHHNEVRVFLRLEERS